MAEGDDTDESQKTEEPTARRLEEARKRGQVVYSREVSNWIVIFAAMIMIMSLGPLIGNRLADTLKTFLSQAHQIPTDGYGLSQVVGDLFLSVGTDVLLPLAILALIGFLGCFIQTGPVITTEPLKPDLSKISVIKGFERLFSKRSLVEFVKGLFKLCVISAAAYMALRPYFDGIEHFIGQDVSAAMLDLDALFGKMVIAILIVLFIIAALDYFYQRQDFMQKMRMSKQEIKEEFRQSEGDPMVKAKLRQIREAKARQRMIQEVPKADVVITNPTHYAVALKYNPKEMAAPMLVAKGVDIVAEKIKEVARENKVTIVENPTLARALYDGMELEQTIPAEFFKAVAEVISYVFKLKGKKV